MGRMKYGSLKNGSLKNGSQKCKKRKTAHFKKLLKYVKKDPKFYEQRKQAKSEKIFF
jgi:hypothetical protein